MAYMIGRRSGGGSAVKPLATSHFKSASAQLVYGQLSIAFYGGRLLGSETLARLPALPLCVSTVPAPLPLRRRLAVGWVQPVCRTGCSWIQ